MRNIFLTIVNVAMIFGAAATSSKNKSAATVTDLYIQKNSTCIKIVSCTGTLTFTTILQDSGGGIQAKIQSTQGSMHLIWEDPNCNTTPVYLV